METYFLKPFIALPTDDVKIHAYVVVRSCAFYKINFIFTQNWKLLDGLEYVDMGCEIDSLESIHCLGEPEA